MRVWGGVFVIRPLPAANSLQTLTQIPAVLIG
jgi:hypothetical protein